jgi:hypothetical protein
LSTIITGRPDPVKLFMAVLASRRESVKAAREMFREQFGNTDIDSGWMPFEFTDYYADEMGPRIERILFSFTELIDPNRLVEAKLLASEVEKSLAEKGKRTVNIDPGYLDFFKAVLATGKPGGIKIYLDHGVYADLALYYEKGKFHPFEWGFPDFRSGYYDDFLIKVRARYKKQTRDLRHEIGGSE